MISRTSAITAARKMRTARPNDPRSEAGNVWMAAFSALYDLIPERLQGDFSSESGVRDMVAARKKDTVG
jgi:hypothetical protein